MNSNLMSLFFMLELWCQLTNKKNNFSEFTKGTCFINFWHFSGFKTRTLGPPQSKMSNVYWVLSLITTKLMNFHGILVLQ